MEGIFSSKFCGSALPAPLPKATWQNSVPPILEQHGFFQSRACLSDSLWRLRKNGRSFLLMFPVLTLTPQTYLQPPSEATRHWYLIPNPKSHSFQSMSQAKGRTWMDDSRVFPSEPACIPYLLSLSPKGEILLFPSNDGCQISQIKNTECPVKGEF